MTIKESNVTINVRDLDKSISFYQSIGFTVKNRWGSHYAQMTAPGIVIGLHPSKELSRTESAGHISIGFTAENFDDAKALLERLAINVQTRQEEGGQFLHFNDPDGTPLYFIESKW